MEQHSPKHSPCALDVVLTVVAVFRHPQMTFSLLEEAPCKAVCDRMPLCDAYEFDQYKQECVIMIMCQQVKNAILAVSGALRQLSHPEGLPTYLRTYLPTYLPTYVPTYLPTCLPTYVPTYLPTYLPYGVSL